MDDLAAQTVDTPKRNPIIAFGVVAVLVIVVTVGVLLFLNNRDNVEFDPIAGAELVPLDTHFYMTFNTDFTSDPWLAMPRLLSALAIKDQVRDELEEAAEEEGYDYDDDIVPALASISRLGFAAQYVSADEGEWVIFFDSRDRTRLIEMLVGNEPDTIHRESRDEALGLDFDTYTESGRSTSSPMVIAIDNNIVYASTDSDHISNFIRRQRDQEPLSESIRFQNAIAEVSDDALIVGYGNGSIFDHRDFRDVIDAFKDSAEVDPRAASLAFSVTAATRGFGAGGIVTLDTGFGSLEQMITAPADIDGLAALTPEDAILFFAAAGLHDGLAEGYSTFERDARELLELYVYPFEDLTGLSIEHDLIPVLGSSYGFAFGGDDLGLEDLDPESLWFLGLLESPEPSTLKDYLELMVDEYEFICLCDSGVVVTDHADYTTVQWPDEPLSNDSLADAPSFRSTRELLPPDPSTLFFFNLAAFPEQVIADMSAEFSNDPDGYDTNLEAILGFAMAGSVDESSFSFDMVLPIDTSGTE